MQQPSPAASSTSSPPALRKNTTEAAAAAAVAALSRQPQLGLSDGAARVPARQDGRVPLRNTYRIELALIEPDPKQPRRFFDETALKELAASIRERDVKQPLTVRWEKEAGKYRIIDGERRYRAATLAGLRDVPCLLEEADSRDVLIDQIVQNWQRADLHPYETADALVRLRDEFHMAPTAIAKLTGKSLGEVSKLIALVEKVIPEVQERVRQVGEASITKTHLYMLSQLIPEQQRRLAARIQRDHLTVVETERLVREGLNPQSQPSRPVGRPRKHVTIKTKHGYVRLSPTSTHYTDAILLAMLHEARRSISRQELSEKSE